MMDSSMHEDHLPQELEEAVNRQVVEEIGEDGYIGYAPRFWAVKQRILKEQYGIDWKTPAERYPGVIFD